ncbi:MAG: hypothetical protein ACRDY0_05830 [Acidimicrobiales bacterium]
MHTVVEILAIVAAGAGGVVGGTWFVVMRRLRRANRLVLRQASPAPTSWLWSWRRAAVLHRRLRGVCQLVEHAMSVERRGSPGPRPRSSKATGRRRGARGGDPATSPLARVAGDLVDHALVIDDRLVRADRLDGRWRRPAMSTIDSEIGRLELSAQRLVGLCAAWRGQLSRAAAGPAAGPPDLHEQLDALEAAFGELGELGPHGPAGAALGE